MTSTSEPGPLNHHHRDTLSQIFTHPLSHNIEWQAVLSLLEALGAVETRPDGKFVLTLGPETETLERPRDKDLDPQQVVDLRRMLRNAGYGPEDEPAGGLTVTEHPGATEAFRGKQVIAAIDFHHTDIYATDAAPDQRPTQLLAADPRGHFHKISHHAGNPDGTYEDDSSGYWKEIGDALAPAGAILLLGHGKGKANASHKFVAYAEEHRKDIAAKIVAEVRADIDDLTNEQVLRLAQLYFGEAPARDFGDSRWGRTEDATTQK
jgi:hypothetical protein